MAKNRRLDKELARTRAMAGRANALARGLTNVRQGLNQRDARLARREQVLVEHEQALAEREQALQAQGRRLAAWRESLAAWRGQSIKEVGNQALRALRDCGIKLPAAAVLQLVNKLMAAPPAANEKDRPDAGGA